MSRQVWKYIIDVNDADQGVEIPCGAKFVKANHSGHKQIALWFEVDIEEPLEETRFFRVFGTGHSIETGLHLATVFMTPFVWHIYEL